MGDNNSDSGKGSGDGTTPETGKNVEDSTDKKPVRGTKSKPSPDVKTLAESTAEQTRKLEKALRSRYEGKTIVLVDTNRVLWAVGRGFGQISLTHIQEDPTAKIPSNQQKIVKGTPFLVLRQIDFAIAKGEIRFIEDVSKEESEYLKSATIVDMNDDGFVEDMEQIDTLLHMPLDAMENDLARLEKDNTSKEFFRKLLKEEKTAKRRDTYIEAIKRYAE